MPFLCIGARQFVRNSDGEGPVWSPCLNFDRNGLVTEGILRLSVSRSVFCGEESWGVVLFLE